MAWRRERKEQRHRGTQERHIWRRLLGGLFLFFLLILFLTALDLRYFVQPYLSYGEWGLLCIVGYRLLIAGASPVAEHRL